MNKSKKSPIPSIKALGASIRAKQQEVIDLARNSVKKACEIGEMLNAARERIPNKKWRAFVELTCGLKMRTAQMYMQMARELPKLDPANAQRVAHLPLNGVLKALISNNKSESGDPIQAEPEPGDPIQPAPESTTSEHGESPVVASAIPEAHGAQSATASATKTGPAAADEAFPKHMPEEITEGVISPRHEPATELLRRVLHFLQVNSVELDKEQQAITRVRELVQQELSMLLAA